jgi:hypothetical protein
MSDFITSLVRTYVPILIGYLVSLGILPSTLSDQATAAFTALIIGVYYLLVRLLETRFPWLGWLLGSPKTPKYAPPAA